MSFNYSLALAIVLILSPSVRGSISSLSHSVDVPLSTSNFHLSQQTHGPMLFNANQGHPHERALALFKHPAFKQHQFVSERVEKMSELYRSHIQALGSRKSYLKPLGMETERDWKGGADMSLRPKEIENLGQLFEKVFSVSAADVQHDIAFISWSYKRALSKGPIWWTSKQLGDWQKKGYDYMTMTRLGDILRFDIKEYGFKTMGNPSKAMKKLQENLKLLKWPESGIPPEVQELMTFKDSQEASMYEVRVRELMGLATQSSDKADGEKAKEYSSIASLLAKTVPSTLQEEPHLVRQAANFFANSEQASRHTDGNSVSPSSSAAPRL
ncbi:hypothetical protein O181_090120 [Austropuccinia psidii MF-1]|uniref:RxLR effector protein n=1 Tax=Austropuccinia psidii MF-1 TaxID=1389203 RepID=A0A9Q3IV68_9BASI|nr:hypothetical protein [Austropuccinia psidii MF-1]